MTEQHDHPQSMGEPYPMHIAVPFDYPVHFTRGAFAPGNSLLVDTLDRLGEGRCHRAAVYVDQGVAGTNPKLPDRIKEYFHAHADRAELANTPAVVPGGHMAKTDWSIVRDVMWTIGNLHLDRQSFVIAIGGGSMLDMVGFATSIVHRGLRLVRLPSTTLAMDDAGVGVKNGMDEHGQKNFVGTFAPPFAVINDFDLLRTLPFTHWIGGVAEAFKVALIKDVELFEFLCAKAADLRRRQAETMEHVVRRAADIHLEHIRTSGDPFEFGSARPLDFGHWAGHRLEILSNYALPHGHAVAVGIALDTCYACRQGLLQEAELERTLDAIDACGLPTWSNLLSRRGPDGQLAVLEGLQHFREHLGGVLTVTLPDGIGRKTEVHHMNIDDLQSCIERLRQRAAERAGRPWPPEA